VNAKSKDGMTALRAASAYNRRDVLQPLLAKGADVNVKDKDGWTALMVASYEGYQEIVKALLDKVPMSMQG